MQAKKKTSNRNWGRDDAAVGQERGGERVSVLCGRKVGDIKYRGRTNVGAL